MAIGWVAKWLGNRSFHCAITGPLFLIAGDVFLISSVRMIHVNPLWVWPFVLTGVVIAFLLEWRYAKRCAPYHAAAAQPGVPSAARVRRLLPHGSLLPYGREI